MEDEDPFAAALAGLETRPVVAEAATRADAWTEVGLGAALVGLVAGLALAGGLLLELVPTGRRVPLAAVGYVLTPTWVMVVRIAVHQRVLRVQRTGAVLTRATEQRLRWLHLLAWPALVAAVPHVWVLAQAANLWLSSR